MNKLLPILFVLLVSCSENSDLFKSLKPQMSIAQRMNAVEVDDYLVMNNQSYGENKFQSYDLHVPKYKKDTIPAVVLVVIHGGAWCMLDKSFMNDQVSKFRQLKKNVAILNINHRLAGINGNNYQSIVEDLDLFMQHITERKLELNLSDEIVIYGYSSGGHLALEYSKLRVNNKNIKAIAATAPPTDLTSEKLRATLIANKSTSFIELLVGESFEKNPDAYRAASPIFKVSKNNKPTILFCGEKDEVVYKEQVETLSKLLTKNEVDNRLIVFRGIGHDMPDQQNEIASQVYKFMRER